MQAAQQKSTGDALGQHSAHMGFRLAPRARMKKIIKMIIIIIIRTSYLERGCGPFSLFLAPLCVFVVVVVVCLFVLFCFDTTTTTEGWSLGWWGEKTQRAVRSRLTAQPGAWWPDKHFSGERSAWSVPWKQLGCLCSQISFCSPWEICWFPHLHSFMNILRELLQHRQSAVVEAASWTADSPEFAITLHSKWSSKLYCCEAMLLHQEQTEEWDHSSCTTTLVSKDISFALRGGWCPY